MKISVIIPNYNHAQYLGRAIAAIFNQTLQPDEVIIVDDCSTDNSVEVLSSLARAYPIKICHHRTNVGCNESMNRAMEWCCGDYVLFTAADDTLRCGVFEEVRKAHSVLSTAKVFSGVSEWKCTTTGNSWLNGSKMPSGYSSPSCVVQLCKEGRFTINNQNAVWHKETLMGIGGWRPELHWYADWFTDHLIAFEHGVYHIPQVLSDFYLYPKSYWNGCRTTDVLTTMLNQVEAHITADMFASSGVVGQFGWPMIETILREKRWRYLNTATTRAVITRICEQVGRKLPSGVQKALLRIYKK